MHLRSDSFEPYAFLDAQYAFGKHDDAQHFALADNRNPHLAWSEVPAGTRSFALICVDPDVPSRGDDVNQEGKIVPIDLPRVDFFHWVVADLPAELREIAAGSHSHGVTARGKAAGPTPDGGLTGLNDYTGWFSGHPEMGGAYAGYDGPAPPWNDARMHGYRFLIFALDVATLGLSGSFDGRALQEAIVGHVLARAELVARYAINPALRR